MTTRIALGDLHVIGYIGRWEPADAPKRLLPVFQSRTEPRILVAPTSEEGDFVLGQEVSQSYLATLLDEEEVTLLASPLAAVSGHLLWMSSTGPRYQSASEAEGELDACAVEAVKKACEARLADGWVRDVLFGALRVRSTVMANALLAVHFTLTEEYRLARPIRSDLAGLSGLATGELEERLLLTARPLFSSSQALATGVAMEVRRAHREDLASEILKDLRPAARRAAEPAPPLLSWVGTLARRPG